MKGYTAHLEVTMVEPKQSILCACGKQVRCLETKPCTNMLDMKTVLAAGPSNFQSWDEIEKKLSVEGGEIVNVNLLTSYEIEMARSQGHLFIDVTGIGYIWREESHDCN